eukprot:TRINITY_DN158_c0_g1_i2.p1 TRINITY_DN158_c0_g1~~TRINITY_DN158_c0_g1_i2.p1  ORF type:complete len:406 (-),score=68.17 TRINITY_DN158_c0_g1_i2:91-1308(-)
MHTSWSLIQSVSQSVDRQTSDSAARYKKAYKASAEALAATPLVERLVEFLPVPSLAQWLIFPIYVIVQVTATRLIPGYDHKGVPLLDGTVQMYKINGLQVCLALIAVFYVASYRYGLFSAGIVYDNFGPLLYTVNVYSFLLSTVLYLKGANSGEAARENFVDDYVMGTQLTPTIYGINVKFFWIKIAMMGWFFINLSFLAKQHELLGFITTPMMLYQLFTGAYIIDYFYFEEYMTSTWDIIAEKFGLMLVWGDIVYIPFVFSLQAWFLLEDNSVLETYEIAGMVAVFALGYTIFRGCNQQKHLFKHDPTSKIWGSVPKAIGGRLLVSGWWGVARHFNYTGDIILGLSYSIPCRFGSFWPWVYPIYLTLLLIHRERRDDKKCSTKYKHLWEEYCEAVPYRMVPGLY